MPMNKNVWQFIWPLVLGIFLGIFTIFIVQNYKRTGKFLSPLGMNPDILASKVPSQKPIIGFLPYWNIGTSQIKYHLLDYIAYFSLDFNFDGSIKKVDDNGHSLPGYTNLHNGRVDEIFGLAKKQDVKLMIVFTAFNNEVIDSIIKSPQYGQNAIDAISQYVTDYNLDAVNIDFEYNQNYPISAEAAELYPIFIQKLSEQLKKQSPNIVITIDLYANAFLKNHSYDSYKLSQAADWLILMGYDFYQTSSPKAGPIAPIKSDKGKSISQALNAAIKNNIDTQKIVLAMPFYGYEWQTTNDEFNAPTYPGTGAMASYRRVHQLIKDEKLDPSWDFKSMSPWIAYEKNGAFYQIYYENDQSIGLKLQLVNQVDLQGAAIWALGYEGKDASVWDVIEQWRKNNNKQ
jgi:chitinase